MPARVNGWILYKIKRDGFLCIVRAGEGYIVAYDTKEQALSHGHHLNAFGIDPICEYTAREEELYNNNGLVLKYGQCPGGTSGSTT